MDQNTSDLIQLFALAICLIIYTVLLFFVGKKYGQTLKYTIANNVLMGISLLVILIIQVALLWLTNQSEGLMAFFATIAALIYMIFINSLFALIKTIKTFWSSKDKRVFSFAPSTKAAAVIVLISALVSLAINLSLYKYGVIKVSTIPKSVLFVQLIVFLLFYLLFIAIYKHRFNIKFMLTALGWSLIFQTITLPFLLLVGTVSITKTDSSDISSSPARGSVEGFVIYDTGAPIDISFEHPSTWSPEGGYGKYPGAFRRQFKVPQIEGSYRQFYLLCTKDADNYEVKFYTGVEGMIFENFVNSNGVLIKTSEDTRSYIESDSSSYSKSMLKAIFTSNEYHCAINFYGIKNKEGIDDYDKLLQTIKVKN